MLRFLHNNHIYSDDFKKPFEEGGMYGHVDLPRLKKGRNGGAFWSAFAPCPSNASDFSDENYSDGKPSYSILSMCGQRHHAKNFLRLQLLSIPLPLVYD
jgi:hypothetical protein